MNDSKTTYLDMEIVANDLRDAMGLERKPITSGEVSMIYCLSCGKLKYQVGVFLVPENTMFCMCVG